jgi:hypothetical protein
VTINLDNLVIAAGGSGWENFIFIIIFAGIAVLKAVFSSATEKKQQEDRSKLKEQWKQRRFRSNEQKTTRFKPLIPQGDSIGYDQSVASVSKNSEKTRYIAADSSSENEEYNHGLNDYIAEPSAIEKYKKRIELAKQRAIAQKRLAQQIRQKAVKQKALQTDLSKQYKAQTQKISTQKPIQRSVINQYDDIDLATMLSNPKNLRTAFILSEILNKPISTR